MNFAINDGAYRTVYGRTGINDGQWHHVAGIVGRRRHGAVRGRDPRGPRPDASPHPKAYDGYWRIGADQTTGFTNRPSDTGLAGSVDEVAVYPKALTKADIQSHYVASGRTGGWGAAPTDTYGARSRPISPDLYWRLGEASGRGRRLLRSAARRQRHRRRSSRGQTGGDHGQHRNELQRPQRAGGRSAVVELPHDLQRGGVVQDHQHRGRKADRLRQRHQRAEHSATTGTSYMQSNGRLSFGVNSGGQSVAGDRRRPTTTGSGTTWSRPREPSGMRLWVDAALVGSNTVSGAQSYLGYWRVGGDRTWGSTLEQLHRRHSRRGRGVPEGAHRDRMSATTTRRPADRR